MKQKFNNYYRGESMDKLSNLKSKIYSSLGFFFLLIPLFYQILWIFIFSKFSTHEERVEHFRNYLPPIIREPGIAPQLFIVFCLLAMIFSFISMQHSTKLMKGANIIMLVVGLLLMLLLLFQLM